MSFMKRLRGIGCVLASIWA